MCNITHHAAQDYDPEQPANQNVAEFANRKLAYFAENCRLFAERVAVGQLHLTDAADMLQSAAEISGLCDMVGNDAVQRTMANAFTARSAQEFS